MVDENPESLFELSVKESYHEHQGSDPSISEGPNSNSKPSICFVALDSFAALADDPRYGHIGGAEIQQVLIGKNLAKRGCRVSFVTLDHGQDNELEVDGIRIIKAYDQDVGIRILRFLHPRLTSLWRAMKNADADIYYQRTRDSTTGIVAAFCRRYRKRFVFAVAHDYDCMADSPDFRIQHARILYRYGIRRAHLVTAQTITQQRLLRENFGVAGTVIPNCAPDYGKSPGGIRVPLPTAPSCLLWVAAFKPAKRLELLLDLARQLSDLRFDVVGDGDARSEYTQRLLLRAESTPNVHLHGKVPHVQVDEFYQRAAVLICTSLAEGFPNIFLEAWARGLPVVSTFDPDGIIVTNGLGIVAKDVRGLASAVRTLLGDGQRWQQASQAARRYYLENHTIDAILPKYERLFEEMTSVERSNAVER